MDQEREDSMDDMMGPIPNPHSISVGPGLHHHQNLKLHHLPKAATATSISSFGALIENDHSFFEGMLNGAADSMTHHLVSSTATNSKPQQPELPNSSTIFSLKRALPGLYWNDHEENDHQAGPSSTATKRLQLDNSDGGPTNNSNIASLLSQLPQTPPLHHQAMLGSLGDGLFRAPFQLPGMNWYS